MGFIKAFAGALGGTFADQWKDFIVPRSDVPATAGVFGAEAKGTNNGRGLQYKGLGEYYYQMGAKLLYRKVWHLLPCRTAL